MKPVNSFNILRSFYFMALLLSSSVSRQNGFSAILLSSYHYDTKQDDSDGYYGYDVNEKVVKSDYVMDV
jgi:hypothetical protein